MARDTLLDFFRDFADLSSEFLVYGDGFRSRTYTYGADRGQIAGIRRALAQ